MANETLRVLLISPLPPPAGGIATWTMKYTEWCKGNNIKVDIINTSVIGRRSKHIGIKRDFIDETIRTLRMLKALRKNINGESTDIVHLNSPCGTFGIIRDYMLATIIKRNNMILVVQYHCNVEDQVGNRRLQKWFLHGLTKKADNIFVLNKISQKYLEKETSRASIIVNNFINNDFILNKKRNFNNKIKNVVFVGHVQPSKGAIEIINVAKKFPKIRFVLVGPVLNGIENMVLSENVLFTGTTNQKKVKKLLLDADIFLFPTHSEGFSIALLEAMAMGLPVITTPVGANSDMIESKGGIIVNKMSEKEIIEAICNLESIRLRVKMSAWNTDKVKKHYTIDKVMKRIICIYYRLVQ